MVLACVRVPRECALVSVHTLDVVPHILYWH
jgi:hypothetical protein